MFATLALDWGWVVSTPPRSFYPLERDPASFVQTTGWSSGPIWTGKEKLASTGIRSPDGPASSKSLYRLRCPGHQRDVSTHPNFGKGVGIPLLNTVP